MTILIDKLLQACVKQGASDIHIVVGQPPVFRLHGRMRKLETQVLEPDDSVALMKSIAQNGSHGGRKEKEAPTLASPSGTWPASRCPSLSSGGTCRWCW